MPLKLVWGVFLKVICTKRSCVFGTEHRCGATLSELESEAEPLYETLDEQVGTGKQKKKTVNLTHLRTGEGPTAIVGAGDLEFHSVDTISIENL